MANVLEGGKKAGSALLLTCLVGFTLLTCLVGIDTAYLLGRYL